MRGIYGLPLRDCTAPGAVFLPFRARRLLPCLAGSDFYFMDLGTVPALGGPPALIVSAFFFLFGFLDLDLALALAFDIFAICDQPRSLTDHSSSFAKARGNYSARPRFGPLLPDSAVFFS
jgi:hypothetical protein